MSVWLTPDLKPFYGGTYFPPTSAWGTSGLRRHPAGDRARLADGARQGRDVGRSADRAAATLDGSRRRRLLRAGRRRARDARSQQFREAFDRAARRFRRRAEVSAPERAAVPAARARAHRATQSARDMVLRTLRAMALGGMRDHIGGGFHRYSVDGDWRVPHFEKMLYDQAQLVLAYLEAAQVVRRSVLCAKSPRTRCLRRARDDRRGRRLLFGRGRRQRSRRAGGRRRTRTRRKAPSTSGAPTSSTRCSATTREVVKLRFGIEPDGNAPYDPQQEFTGKNLLYIARSIDDIATRPAKPADEVVAALAARAARRCSKLRLARPRPHLRRQGADGVERADDRRVRARARGCCAAPAAADVPDVADSTPAARVGAARSCASGCGTPTRQIAAAPLSRRPRGRSRATRRTTPT